MLATFLWVLGTAAFLFYVNKIARLGVTYGAFATPIVLLVWLYLSGMIALLGAAFNAELEERRDGGAEPTALARSFEPHSAVARDAAGMDAGAAAEVDAAAAQTGAHRDAGGT